VKKYLKILTAMVISSSTLIGVSLINKMMSMHAISKNLLEKEAAKEFVWRFGNIKYRKKGHGNPVLLVHSLDVAASSEEWFRIRDKLAESHTVYSIDLLGCGLSEKPFMTYTNHIFAQLICDFIKVIIGKRTTVISSGNSSAFVISACDNDSTLFEKIILVSPENPDKGQLIPGKRARTYKAILSMSVLGNLLYNIAVFRWNIRYNIRSDFYRKDRFTKDILDKCYEAAHRGLSPRSLYSSIVCFYTKKNIKFELSQINNSIVIFEGKHNKEASKVLREYMKINPAVETVIIDDSNKYPHIENDKGFLNALNIYL
jgi:hydrolase, alpha/beta domain protein